MSFSRNLKRTDHLLRRWAEEPIGVAVPFLAFLAVWLPPQMPDMFAGMEAPLWKLQISTRPFLFALAAMMLGLSAWFWTRAALTAQREHGETDKARISRKKSHAGKDAAASEQPRHRPHTEDYVDWSHEWAPRIALLAAGGITLLPILFSIASGSIMVGLLGMELLSCGLVGLLFAFVVNRTKFRWMDAFGAPRWMLRFRSTRILACAPFGWPFALLSLACSAIALICLIVRPDWVAAIDAPTTAIAALAFAVGPLVIALAIFRGIVEQAFFATRWLAHRGEPPALIPGERHRVKRLSNALGTIAMLVWFLSPPWVVEKHRVPLAETRVIEPAGSGDCDPVPGGGSEPLTCRPSLKAALKEWVASRRQGDPASLRLPLIIVAAEGGASRAAAWMLASLRMLDHQTGGETSRHIFAISGVSGGSLGAASYLRMVAAKGDADGRLNWENPEIRHALKAISTSDLLSATISTYFLSDMFGSLIGPAWTLGGVPDRNAALELAFQLLWKRSSGFQLPEGVDSKFLGLRTSIANSSTVRASLPHLMLNGTDVITGKRIITSSIRINADTALFPDSGDFIRLVARDIELATGVTNSARFPFVSPAGRFISTTEARDYQIIDGGYFENYGARTAWELARAIEDLNAQDPTLNVVPIIVVVSNDLEADQPPRSVHGKCRKQLGDINEDGSQVTIRCDEPAPIQTCIETYKAGMGPAASVHDQSIVPQSFAPILGLAATRSAHGRDALNIVKRDFCRAQTNAPGEPRTRMIHIAMPRPDRDKGEAAPMNWVLNPASCNFMLNKAPWLDFNLNQARKLDGTLSAIRGLPANLSAIRPPQPIDCGN
jgi:hypothetical protein